MSFARLVKACFNHLFFSKLIKVEVFSLGSLSPQNQGVDRIG